MSQSRLKGSSALVALLAVLALTACGEGDATTSTAERADGSTADVADADPGDVAVISGWVNTLATGDVEGAARYFALPSIAENGPLVIRIRTFEDAVSFNETLPCGAELLSAETIGDFTAATFRLLERPGGSCGAGTGGTAATSFLIEEGKIVEWRRVGIGDGDGDGGGGRAT
jgi:hypothetical protein